MTARYVKVELEASYTPKATLLESLYVSWGIGNFLTVGAGFSTDFASVPRILWWLFPPIGRHTVAAVTHDYLYKTKRKRSVADKIFLDVMLQHNTTKWKAYTMYLGVRLFGWHAYNKKA